MARLQLTTGILLTAFAFFIYAAATAGPFSSYEEIEGQNGSGHTFGLSISLTFIASMLLLIVATIFWWRAKLRR